MHRMLDFMEWKHKAVASTRPLDRSLQYFLKLSLILEICTEMCERNLTRVGVGLI